MFIPYGDTPNPPNDRPWVTWALMALNIAVYLFITLPLSTKTPNITDPSVQSYLQHLSSGSPRVPLSVFVAQLDGWSVFTFHHGFKPGAPEFSDLFAAMFMHGGFMHLAGNMLFLWIYGDNVEHRFGHITYLLVYLSTGVAATLAFSLVAGGSMVPLVGASGAISGVLGCYFLLFPRNRVKVFVAFFPFLFTTVLVPARIVLGVFLIIDNVFPALLSSPGSGGVAYGAHIGGFVAGLLAAYVIDRAPQRRRRRGPVRARKKTEKSTSTPIATKDDSPESALQHAIATGDRTTAIDRARQLPPSQITQQLGGDVVVLSEWLAEAQEPLLSMTLLRRALSLGRGEIDQARVYLALGLVRLAQEQPTAAYQHLLAVFDHAPDEETEARAREALTKITPN